MFERFTDTARRVVVYAQEEARLLDHSYIGTEHILLGLLHDDTETAVQVLTAIGADLQAVRGQVEEIIGRGQDLPAGDIPFTPRAKKVLELSLREALQLGHNYIGSEHILLGLLREREGVGAQVLERLGAGFDELRQSILTLLRARQRPRRSRGVFPAAAGGLEEIETRLTAIEERLARIERLLQDGSSRDSA
ncbi:MAG: class stress response-related ATPase [Actinoallomurus sp.]|nr:class stress response-related ATPase [Actinoallomurus sp.]